MQRIFVPMNRILPIFLPIVAVLCAFFCSCTTEGERQRMAQIIAEADSLNRNYIPLTSDSLLLEACRYYDRFGSPNERMKAIKLVWPSDKRRQSQRERARATAQGSDVLIPKFLQHGKNE